MQHVHGASCLGVAGGHWCWHPMHHMVRIPFQTMLEKNTTGYWATYNMVLTCIGETPCLVALVISLLLSMKQLSILMSRSENLPSRKSSNWCAENCCVHEGYWHGISQVLCASGHLLLFETRIRIQTKQGNFFIQVREHYHSESNLWGMVTRYCPVDIS